jgi:hypothetical protein
MPMGAAGAALAVPGESRSLPSRIIERACRRP